MDYPVGFRFYFEDDELINDYLRLKRLVPLGYPSEVDDVIAEVDILKYEPWELPEKSVIRSNDPFWFFFYKLVYKNKLAVRKTKNGFWKVTGKDHKVCTRDTNEKIGIKKILTYYRGKSPNAVKTNWVIHEYHPTASDFPNQSPFVVCRLKKKDDETDDNSTPDEGESSHHVPLDHGNFSEYTSRESRMVMEQGQNIPYINGSYNDSSEQGNEDFVDSLFVDEPIEEIEFTHLSGSSPPKSLERVHFQSHSVHFQSGSDTDAETIFVQEQGGPALTEEYWPMWMVQASSSTNMPYQINCIELANEAIPTLKSQYQPRSHKTVEEGVAPSIIKLQDDFSSKAIIRDKVGEVAKHGTVDMLKKENTNVDSNKDMKVTQKTDAKMSLKLSWNGPASSDQKGFFIFMDTPPLSHGSNPLSVYLINTILGIILLIVVLWEVILFGDWS